MITATKLALLSLVTAALHLPIRKVYHDDDEISVAKRSNWPSSIYGNGLSFLAEVEIGTPPQKETVIVDTGSSDLWFATPEICNTNAQGNAPANASYIVSCKNVFDITKSSSLVNTTIPFAIGYGDGSSSNGFYVQDTLSVAGTTIENANCAYAYKASAPSIMGIGFPLNEACVYFERGPNGSFIVSDEGSCTPYPNVPQQFKDQGKISSTAYSIWLNDLSSYEGSILFGGVDHAKYIGPLVTLPIDAEPVGYSTVDGSVVGHLPEYTRTLVTLNQVKLINAEGASDVLLEGAIPILLDTGSTECSLPSALVNSLAAAFNAIPDGQGGWFLNCGVTETAYIALNFRGLEIQVPFRQFVRPFTDNYGDFLVEWDNGIDYCYFGASADDGDTFPILGDNVLSSFYAVFDLEKGEIALAPAVYNQYETDIEDITDSIPRAVQAPAYSYSFSSHLQINPSPTISFSFEPVSSVYHQTGTLVGAELTATAVDEAAKAKATAQFVNIAHIGAPARDVNATASPSSSSTWINSYGMTNIIGFGITQDLPDGISTVYSAGPPSTLSPSQFSSTKNASTSAFSNSSIATTAAASGFNSTMASSPTTTESSGSETTVTATAAVGTVTSAVAGATSGTTGAAGANATNPASGSAVTSASSSTAGDASPDTTNNASGSSITGATSGTTDAASADAANPVPTSATTVTNDVTIFSTYCPEATTFTYGGSAYTVTEATTLTITICDAPHPNTTASVQVATAPGPEIDTFVTETENITIFTTYCPEPTTFTYGDSTYTFTEATTITITNCPEKSTTAVPTTSTPASISSSTPVAYTSAASSSAPVEVPSIDTPSTIASNGAVKASICGALLIAALV